MLRQDTGTFQQKQNIFYRGKLQFVFYKYFLIITREVEVQL
ncbi:MAG: hypothetical protein ACFWUG_02265 [Rahnella inusitata]|jgi:hypothetical protein